jgi:catechol 2,3-dioxygenase-like lactoylglutathione lyase family enzyme
VNDKAPERGFAFAQMTPELLVSDLAQSLAFWRDLCGFAIAYERQEDGFVYLDRAGSQVMLKALASPTRAWMSGKLEKPFGRGVNFQFRVDDVDQLAATLDAANWPFVLPLEDKRYRVGSAEILVRQFAVADPDGYLVRFSQDIAG